MSDVNRTAAPRQPSGSARSRAPREAGAAKDGGAAREDPGVGGPDLTADERRALAELLRVSPVADELGRRFHRAGHELHLVGGSGRDALLGRLGDDLDFATDARPAQTLALVAGWARTSWETRREVGTIGGPRRGLRREITTDRAK